MLYFIRRHHAIISRFGDSFGGMSHHSSHSDDWLRDPANLGITIVRPGKFRVLLPLVHLNDVIDLHDDSIRKVFIFTHQPNVAIIVSKSSSMAKMGSYIPDEEPNAWFWPFSFCTSQLWLGMHAGTQQSSISLYNNRNFAPLSYSKARKS